MADTYGSGSLRRLALALWAAVLPATELSAQSLRVQVLESGTGRPLAGALLSVLDAQDSTLVRGLTDELGRGVLELSPAARRVRADLLGYTTSSVVVDGAGAGGSTPLVLELPPAPLRIEGVVASAESRCAAGPTRDAHVADLWDEARKALEVARWAIAESRYSYEVEGYSRRYDRDGRTLQDVTRDDAGYFREPFSSRSPAELAAQGYLRVDGDWTTAIAPDAEVLLSEEFLDRHCFSLLDDGGSDFGLAFEPVARSETADIAGAILLDRRTAALRAVRFEYVGTLAEDRVPEARGEVAFERLPSGAWVVRDWWVRTPVVEIVRMGFGFESVDSREVVGFYEVGGAIRAVRDADGETVLARERGGIQGTASRSGSGAPVVGARVALRGTAWGTESDSTGHFALVDLPPGDYVLELFHGRLPGPVSQDVAVRAGESLQVGIEVPLAAAVSTSPRAGLMDRPASRGDDVPADTATEVVSIAGLEVEVERSPSLVTAGFYERRKGGQGQYLDRSDIDERNATLSDDLLEGIPGVRVVRVGHRRGLNLEGNRVTTFGRASGEVCSPSVWIDDVQVVMGGRDEVVELDVLIRPDLIEGIEVYTSSSRIPVRFNVNAMCGVIVVWTRGSG